MSKLVRETKNVMFVLPSSCLISKHFQDDHKNFLRIFCETPIRVLNFLFFKDLHSFSFPCHSCHAAPQGKM